MVVPLIEIIVEEQFQGIEYKSWLVTLVSHHTVADSSGKGKKSHFFLLCKKYWHPQSAEKGPGVPTPSTGQRTSGLKAQGYAFLAGTEAPGTRSVVQALS